MPKICEFGAAPEQGRAGYSKLAGVMVATDEDVLERFKDADVRLVRGGDDSLTGRTLFYVAAKPQDVAKFAVYVVLRGTANARLPIEGVYQVDITCLKGGAGREVYPSLSVMAQIAIDHLHDGVKFADPDDFEIVVINPDTGAKINEAEDYALGDQFDFGEFKGKVAEDISELNDIQAALSQPVG